MILDDVVQDPDLFAIRRLVVSENGVGITFHPALLLNDSGDLCDEKVCILKLDDYNAYNSRYTHNPPKVVDNLIIVQCQDNASVSLYLVELRKSNGMRPTRRLTPTEIEEKFATAVNDFLGVRYRHIFNDVNISSIQAFLVTDPWRHSGKPNAEALFRQKVKTSALDAYASRRPLFFRGHSIQINPILPPEPVIEPC